MQNSFLYIYTYFYDFKKNMGEKNKKEWESGLCMGCCSHGPFNTFMACCLTPCFYAQVKNEIEEDGQNNYMINCCKYICLSNCCLGWLLTWPLRIKVIEEKSIDEKHCTSCLISCCCACCSLLQIQPEYDVDETTNSTTDKTQDVKKGQCNVCFREQMRLLNNNSMHNHY